mmetsp:Transcript_4791/g.7679  ORF Transcript_4791/g.7679 Transcript_4791/m.7679 type:complete len:96 (+) Transcript_4791:1160-1447(+)
MGGELQASLSSAASAVSPHEACLTRGGIRRVAEELSSDWVVALISGEVADIFMSGDGDRGRRLMESGDSDLVPDDIIDRADVRPLLSGVVNPILD